VTSVKSAFKPALLGLIAIVLVGSLTYWLWQRQPNPDKSQSQTEAPKETIQEKIDESQLEITPSSGSVLSENTVTFQGKTQPNNYIVLSSNNTLGITQANENGGFEIEAELVNGLSLIDVISVDENLVEQQSLSLSLFVDPDTNASTAISGSVKGILDNIITITTTKGEQTIRQKSSTELILPESEKGDEGNDIRVGDYLIALGAIENEKDFNATSIEIIREDKPQNSEKYVAGTILSNVKEDIFSFRNQKDSGIFEFTLSDDTTISLNGDNAEAEKIVKGKKAIVIYFTEKSANTPDLIYLLP